MKFQDYYEVLGLERGADEESIKKVRDHRPAACRPRGSPDADAWSEQERGEAAEGLE